MAWQSTSLPGTSLLFRVAGRALQPMATQTAALPPTAPPRHKIVLLFFSVCGFTFNLVVLGLIVSMLGSLLDRLRRRYQVVVANRHTVILGWTDRTLFLMGEMAEVRAPAGAAHRAQRSARGKAPHGRPARKPQVKVPLT